jgi:protein-S-isoprenylcysteine O-methyltransferase Ste14
MDETQKDTKPKYGAARWLLRETIGNLVLIAILFGVVGRLDWWNGWAMSAAYLLWTLGTIIFILPVNPQMLAERSRPHKDAKKWDLVMVGVMGLFVFIAYVVASLDVRNGWSSPFPLVIQIIGAVTAIFGYVVLVLWAMISNAYFTAVVRIQTERQHTVATTGPYRFVRHPGYVGTILFYLSTPFVLNSRWALIPSILAAVVLLIRTAKEDKTLQEELPGYKEYAERVRYRLLPGIW